MLRTGFAGPLDVGLPAAQSCALGSWAWLLRPVRRSAVGEAGGVARLSVGLVELLRTLVELLGRHTMGSSFINWISALAIHLAGGFRRLRAAAKQYGFFCREWRSAGYALEEFSWHHTPHWGCESRRLTTNPRAWAADRAGPACD